MPKNFSIPEQAPDRLGKPFWTIVHNFLRHDDNDSARADGAASWFQNHVGSLQRISSKEQEGVLQYIYDAFRANGAAPSWPLIRDGMIHDATLADYADEYEALAPKIPLVPATDLPVLVQNWERTRRRQMAASALELAQEVFAGNKRVEGHDGRPVLLAGPEAAFDLIAETRDELYRSNSQTSTFVTLGDDRSQEIIRQGSDAETRKVIPTGFKGVDAVLAMNPGQSIGVLGGAGAGKSRLARSMGYNMAREGFRVLHVQLETHEVAEVYYYSLIHAFQDGQWASTAQSFALTFNRLNRGQATLAATAWLNDVVVADMREVLAGSISILSPATNRWDQIQAEIETLNQEFGFDVVIIDYLTLCEAGSSRDKDGRVNQAISAATNWAKGANILLVTPVQGRRDAAIKARDEADGLWDLSGIYRYSDYDRHLTACLSLTVMHDGAIHLGLPKNRWGAPVFTPFVVAANHACGYISEALTFSSMGEDQDMNTLLEDI